MTYRLLPLILTATLLPVATGYASDTDLILQKLMPMRLVVDAAEAVIAACNIQSAHVSVVIVDQAGNIRIQLLSDGGNFTTMDSARRKAYTAAIMGRATADIEQQVATNPASAPGDGNPSFLFKAGGVPIRAGGEVIGGIGVGGSGPGTDAKCAQAGIDRIQAFLK